MFWITFSTLRMQIVPGDEEDAGYVDSIFGRGTWNRLTDGVFTYVN